MRGGDTRLWQTMDVINAIPTADQDEVASQPSRTSDALGAVIFDLDGTLVDPAGGITQGIAHALRAMNLPVPEQQVLNAMIGPKLGDALVGLANVPAELVDAVVLSYRSWYGIHGIAMSRPYEGVRELLVTLRAAGYRVAVATQKPEPLAQKLLAHHGLADLIDVIRGSNPDESIRPGHPDYRAGKKEIIATALEDVDAGPHGKNAAIMVGDRYQDVEGATANDLECIGVGWGFSADNELVQAGAACVVENVVELADKLGLSATAVSALALQLAQDSSQAEHGAL